MFIQEVIKSFYENNKKIEVSEKYSEDTIKKIVFTGMKHTNRFNGLTKRPYCLIEHSWLVSKTAQDLYKIYCKNEFSQWEYNFVGLLGLVHDIGEVIIGDTVYPLKTKLNCENCLKTLEENFVCWFLKKCYGYNDFSERYFEFKKLFKECFDYVDQADHQIGTFEMIGISINDKFEANEQFKEMLNSNLKDIKTLDENIVVAFEKRLNSLIKEIKL